MSLYQLAANSRAFYWHHGGYSVNVNLLGLGPRARLCAVPCVSGTRWHMWLSEQLGVGPGMGSAADLICSALVSEARTWLAGSVHPGGRSRPVPRGVGRWKEGRCWLLPSLEGRQLGSCEEKALVDASHGVESWILVLRRNFVVVRIVLSLFLFNPYHQFGLGIW